MALSLPKAQVQSLVRELRSHKPCGMAKKKKKTQLSENFCVGKSEGRSPHLSGLWLLNGTMGRFNSCHFQVSALFSQSWVSSEHWVTLLSPKLANRYTSLPAFVTIWYQTPLKASGYRSWERRFFFFFYFFIYFGSGLALPAYILSCKNGLSRQQRI